jgi:hypothetical protein
VNGTRYTFDVYGLYNGLFVMADRQTGSVWTHFDGTILTGPLSNQAVRLEIQPVIHTTWGEWRAAYPTTTVLDWYPEFESRYREIQPGRGGLGPEFLASILNWDDRLPENELVLGVNLGTEYRAYVLSDFGGGLQVVEDELGGVPIVVFLEPASAFGLAFQPGLEGVKLSLTVVDGEILDQDGGIWDRSGRGISGPWHGSQLPYVTSFVTEWYGWAAYHPETSIYGR